MQQYKHTEHAVHSTPANAATISGQYPQYDSDVWKTSGTAGVGHTQRQSKLAGEAADVTVYDSLTALGAGSGAGWYHHTVAEKQKATVAKN